MNRHVLLVLAGALCATLCTSTVHAGSEPEAGEHRDFEPVNVEEVLPTELHEVNVRVGTRYVRWSEHADLKVMQHSAQLFVGVMPRVSLEAAIPYVMLLGEAPRRSGAGSVSLGAKARLTPEAMLPLVLRLETALPAGDEAFGESHAEVEWSLGTYWRNERLQLQGNAGTFTMVGAGEKGAFYEASLATPVSPGLSLFAEAAGEYSLESEEHGLGIGPGIQFALTPRASVALGALFGVGANAGQTVTRAYVQAGF